MRELLSREHGSSSSKMNLFSTLFGAVKDNDVRRASFMKFQSKSALRCILMGILVSLYGVVYGRF